MMLDEIDTDFPRSTTDLLISMSITTDNSSREANSFSQKLFNFIKSSKKENKFMFMKQNIDIAYNLSFEKGMSVESFIVNTLNFYLKNISNPASQTLVESLRYAMKNILNIICMILPYCDDVSSKSVFTEEMISLSTDLRTSYLQERIMKAFDSAVTKEDKLFCFETCIDRFLIKQSYILFQEMIHQREISTARCEDLLLVILEYWYNIINYKEGRLLFHQFFFTSDASNLTKILFCFVGFDYTQKFSSKIIEFFLRLMTDQESGLASEQICTVVNQAFEINVTSIKSWLLHLIFGHGVSINDTMSCTSCDNDENIKMNTSEGELKNSIEILSALKQFCALLLKNHKFYKITKCNIITGKSNFNIILIFKQIATF